jgi:hypothetical protein
LPAPSVATDEVKNVDAVQAWHCDVKDEQVRIRRGEVIEDESAVRHVIGGDRQALLERRLDRSRCVGVVLSYEDALHTTTRRARMRRKIRSLMQSLQRHMSEPPDAPRVPGAVRRE